MLYLLARYAFAMFRAMFPPMSANAKTPAITTNTEAATKSNPENFFEPRPYCFPLSCFLR